jgi:hypothetical protein
MEWLLNFASDANNRTRGGSAIMTTKAANARRRSHQTIVNRWNIPKRMSTGKKLPRGQITSDRTSKSHERPT